MANVKIWECFDTLAVVALGVSGVSTPSVTSGYSRLVALGTNVFGLLDMSLCTGVECIPAVEVFLQSSRLSQVSFLSFRTFLKRPLSTFTADVALPLDLG